MPWWPALWDQNYFASTWPTLRSILTNNFVRGAVTGLGLVNLAAGVTDLGTIFSARASSAAVDSREPQGWSGRS